MSIVVNRDVSQNSTQNGKQWRSWWDRSLWAISSGSILFAQFWFARLSGLILLKKAPNLFLQNRKYMETKNDEFRFRDISTHKGHLSKNVCQHHIKLISLPLANKIKCSQGESIQAYAVRTNCSKASVFIHKRRVLKSKNWTSKFKKVCLMKSLDN